MEATSSPSHLARKPAITRGYVEGIEVRALCGERLVPTRDPQGDDTCPDCRFVLALLCGPRSMN